MKKPFIQTAFGSFLKLVVGTLIGQVLVLIISQTVISGPILNWDKTIWLGVLNSVLSSGIVVTYNWYSKTYPMYGVQPKDEIVVDNPAVN